MNALRDKHIRAVGKGDARPRNTKTNRNRGQTSGKRPCNRCGSSFLTSAQGNYATIELECLAIQYALSKSEFTSEDYQISWFGRITDL